MSGAGAIGQLRSLPVFYALGGRSALVVGCSDGARWKADLLRAAGADVLHREREWQPDDLDGAVLAVAEIAEGDEAVRFASAARGGGVPVNLVDRPALSDFTFGTIVERGPILIAVSTGGAAPMLGQSIRARIEAALPHGLSRWAEAALRWRPRLKERLGAFGARRMFWQRFVERAWAAPDDLPDESDFRALLAGDAAPRGSVTLVGAGPGDAGLLTLKAVQALQRATVILHDRLIGADVLELARREARRIPVGKSGHGPSCSQREINAQIVALARAGETVVRLKGGDPLVFGRASEELDACRAAGVAVSVIPGVTAAQGAAAALGLSLTERGRARRVQYVTGHGADGQLPADIDWGAVADRTTTTVIYMPRRTLADFARKALARGLDPATPAVAIASATLPDEARVAATIAELPKLAARLPGGAPVTVILGWVVRRLGCAPAEVVPFPKRAAQ